MKKKWLCLLFALLMVASLAACGNKSDNTADKGKSDMDSFMEVQKNMQDIKDLEFKMDMKTDIPSEEGDLNMTMTGTGKEVIKSKDDIELEMKYKADLAGTKMDGAVYMKDNVVYADMMGQKIKTDTSSEMGAIAKMDTKQLLQITEEMVSDLQVSEDGSNTIYKVKMDANKALDYFAKNAAGAESIKESTEGVTVENMDMTVTADKDKMAKDIDMDFTMNMKPDDKTTTMHYKMTISFISINTDLKIDFPNFSKYKEMAI